MDELGGTGHLGSPELGERAKFGKILAIFSMYGANLDAFSVEGKHYILSTSTA